MEEFDKSKFLPLFKEETYGRIRDITRELLAFEKNKADPEIISELKRAAHTIKGSARMLGLEDISRMAHGLEDILAGLPGAQEAAATQMINSVFDKLDSLKKSIEDLGKEEKVIHKQEELLRVPLARMDKLSILSWYINEEVSRFNQNLEALKGVLKVKDISEELKAGLNSLIKGLAENQDRLASLMEQVQGNLNRLRLAPLSVLLEDFPRMIRDISVKEKKEAEVSLGLGSVGIDKLIAEEVKAALIHTVNNAVRHGIEMPQERINLNKPAKGSIKISASLKANRVFITIEDDGRGIDPEMVQRLALEKKLVTEEQLLHMTPSQILRLILLPGFSSSVSVDTLSGRGVGLDAVRDNIERLSGTVEIESCEHKFTRFIFSLPLTIGMTSGILLKSGGQFFAIPIPFAHKNLKVNPADILGKDGFFTLRIDNSLVPVVKLEKFLNLPVTHQENKSQEAVMIAQCAGRYMGLIVDEILEERQLLLRSFGNLLGKVKYLCGAAILPEARICLVLDIPEIYHNFLTKES